MFLFIYSKIVITHFLCYLNNTNEICVNNIFHFTYKDLLFSFFFLLRFYFEEKKEICMRKKRKTCILPLQFFCYSIRFWVSVIRTEIKKRKCAYVCLPQIFRTTLDEFEFNYEKTIYKINIYIRRCFNR
jgi:hypothetical protein